MPKYLFYTEEIVRHEHELDIVLPVDMGESSTRLTDRMAKTVAKENAIDGITNEEKVVAVYRSGTKIWPRERTKKNWPKPGDVLVDETGTGHLIVDES